MRHRLAALGFGLWLLLAAGAAQAGTTVSFYSHGWGVGVNGFLYFPHAFVVIRRATTPDAAPQVESYGYTAASVYDPTVIMRPSRGVVEQPNETYRKHATLHFTVEISDDQYRALRERVSFWGASTSPLYNLNGHNCISFVADLATTIGLQIPDAGGRDPDRFLEGVKRLNAGRLTEAAAGQAVVASP
jgi:hypothetical protein